MDLRKVAAFWRGRHHVGAEVSVAEVFERYEDSAEWSRFATSTRSGKKSVLAQFCSAFGEIPASRVRLEDVEDYLDKIPHTITRNNHIRILRTFFKWAAGRKNRFVRQSPLISLQTEPEESSLPVFIPLEKVRALFDAAVRTDSGMIPFLALGFFAGIRPDEILRMEPRDFLFSDRRIQIRPEVAKRKRKGRPLPRILEDLPETVWKWLAAVDFDGRLDCASYIVRRRNLYAAAGIEWCNSAARHTFATYAYAKFNDGGKVRKWTGHRGGDNLLLTSYAALEEHARGIAYFEILPPSERIVPVRRISKYGKRAAWPSDERLLELTTRKTNREIAAIYGVTEAAVRKRVQRIRS